MVAQLRGVDLAVKLRDVRSAKRVSIELKADNTSSGNISLEIFSQDRPNAKHSEPVVGWTAKDSCVVMQLFMQTGDMVAMNMTLFYPWLFEQLCNIADGRERGLAMRGAWFSATPNPTYNSHNIIVPIGMLLADAPGCLYLRARDVLAQEKCAMLLKDGRFPKDLMLANRPYDADVALGTLKGWLSNLGGYDVKPQLSPERKERLLRFLEERVKFSKARPEVEILGRKHIASRPRLALAEDKAAA
jgi:hypothetical protein